MTKMRLFGLVPLLLGAAAHASLVNFGFETGDTTGWTVNPANLASVVTSATAYNGTTYTAMEGNYFLELSAGAGANVNTVASQPTLMAAGEVVSGYAAFLAFDYLPFNDNSAVSISAMSGNTTVWSSDIKSVGNDGNTPWTAWSFTAPAAGTYTFQYTVRNARDNYYPSVALFDAAPVPEPSTFVTGALLLLPFGFLLCRKSKAQP